MKVNQHSMRNLTLERMIGTHLDHPGKRVRQVLKLSMKKKQDHMYQKCETIKDTDVALDELNPQTGNFVKRRIV